MKMNLELRILYESPDGIAGIQSKVSAGQDMYGGANISSAD